METRTKKSKSKRSPSGPAPKTPSPKRSTGKTNDTDDSPTSVAAPPNVVTTATTAAEASGDVPAVSTNQVDSKVSGSNDPSVLRSDSNVSGSNDPSVLNERLCFASKHTAKAHLSVTTRTRTHTRLTQHRSLCAASGRLVPRRDQPHSFAGTSFFHSAADPKQAKPRIHRLSSVWERPRRWLSW